MPLYIHMHVNTILAATLKRKRVSNYVNFLPQLSLQSQLSHTRKDVTSHFSTSTVLEKHLGTYLCLPRLGAALLVPAVRSRSVGRMAVEWATTGPSCSAQPLAGRWLWADGEATKPSSSDNSCCCCFFKTAFCLARSLARFALARSYRSYHATHIGPHLLTVLMLHCWES